MMTYIASPLRRFVRDGRANVGTIFALSVPVLALGVGIAVDFTNAAVTRNRLNAAADAAALSALTPDMMKKDVGAAQTAATNMFNGRVQALTNVSLVNPPSVTVGPSPTNSSMRVATVSYSASVTTLFGGVLSFFGALPSGQGMVVGGTSTAQAAGPANVNFYLLLDNSPSMALPSTTAGINLMQALTPQEGSCAFACHQASTNNGDTQGNPCSDGSTPTIASGSWSHAYCAATNPTTHLPIKQIDNFQLARNNNITLRLDELTSGVTTLMQTAHTYQTTVNPTSPPVYQFAAYSMDTLWSIGDNNKTTNYKLMDLTTDYQNTWTNTASGKFGVMEMFSNDVSCATSACTSGGTDHDVSTNYDIAMSSINTAMPNPGNGSNQSGDTPQEVLFFVTDGVEDEVNGAGNRIIQMINANGATNYCDKIKARGIKIAILYTDYLPVPSNGFYMGNVAPFQANIAASLQACASTGLFYEATVDTNLGQALSSLFNKFVQQNAALSN